MPSLYSLHCIPSGRCQQRCRRVGTLRQAPAAQASAVQASLSLQPALVSHTTHVPPALQTSPALHLSLLAHSAPLAKVPFSPDSAASQSSSPFEC